MNNKKQWEIFREKNWQTADGRNIPIKNLENDHVENIIKMLHRRLDEYSPLHRAHHDILHLIHMFRFELRERELDPYFDDCGLLKKELESEEEWQLNSEEGENQMNYSAAVFLVSDDVQAIGVQFDEGGKTYVYKSLLDNVNIGDYVIVSANGGMEVAKVVTLDADIQLEGSREYKWAIQKVDLKAYEALLEKEREMVDKVKRVDRKAKREKLRQEWHEHGGDELKAITFNSDDVIDVAEDEDTDEKE